MAALSATRAVGLPARSGELLRLPVARASLLTWLARPTCLPDLLLATKCRRDQRRPWALAVRRRHHSRSYRGQLMHHSTECRGRSTPCAPRSTVLRRSPWDTISLGTANTPCLQRSSHRSGRWLRCQSLAWGPELVQEAEEVSPQQGQSAEWVVQGLAAGASVGVGVSDAIWVTAGVAVSDLVGV